VENQVLPLPCVVRCIQLEKAKPGGHAGRSGKCG
jgi:hypothetical protein